MNETEAFRICPRCGSREVPKLIVNAARVDSSGSSWRCRGCGCDWTDAEYFVAARVVGGVCHRRVFYSGTSRQVKALAATSRSSTGSEESMTPRSLREVAAAITAP